MRTWKLMTTFAFLLMAFGVLQAQTNPPKIAIVDADRVIQNSERGKKFLTEYEGILKTKGEELEAMVTDLRNQEKDFQAKQASLSPEKAQSMRLAIQDLQTSIKRKQEDAERETKSILSTQLEKYRNELGPLIRAVAVEMNLNLVINNGPNSNIVYFKPDIDITPNVIKKFDEQAN